MSATAKRHLKVERGIYKRETADGIRYEYCYPDETGKTRWETVRTLDGARKGRANKITADDRATRAEPETPHEWTDDEVAALLAASVALAGRKESRYDYALLLRVTATLGLRIGEVLGLQWIDFNKDGGFLHVRRQWLR